MEPAANRGTPARRAAGRRPGREQEIRRPLGRGSGALLAAAPAPFAVASWAHGPATLGTLSWQLAATCAVAACAFAGGAALCARPRLGRGLAAASLLGTIALAAAPLLASPLRSFCVLLGATAALGSLWHVGWFRLWGRRRRGRLLEDRPIGAAGAALAFWGLMSLGSEHAAPALLAVAASHLVVAALALRWLARRQEPHRLRARLLGAGLGLSMAIALASWGAWWTVASSGAALAATALAVMPRTRGSELESGGWWEPLLGHPERLFVGTFLAMCLMGTLLLALPQCAASGHGIGLLDAAFTAVSAVCVTGLGVLDTPVDFSAFGHVVILVLIQLGGLGIMTFSTAALRVLGMRMSLRHEGAVASLVSPRERGRVFDATRRILVFTFAAEAAGAALLLAAFLGQGDPLPQALWRAAFTAISAFCNAGFALQSNNLIAYQGDPLVLHVVAGLILAGSLSPAAVLAVPRLVRRSPRPVPVQATLSLAASGVLLAIGFLAFLSFEWDHALVDLPVQGRVHNAWFQSVTLRTAGFNSIDLTDLYPATLVMMMLLMFIGGSPGGTAGGVKTTTVAVLVLLVVNAVRGTWQVTVFGRRLPLRTVHKAAVIVALGSSVVVIASLAMLLTQAMPARLAVFEVVSALGTVGLTIGGSGMLDGVGKVIIMACMFAGRVGTLTVLMFLSQRVTPVVIARPEEDIDVG